MPAAMKRPASLGGASAKRAKPEATERKVDRSVVAALAKRKAGSEALPHDVVAMLTAMLPAALGRARTPEEPAPARHQFQENLLTFVAKELKTVEAGLLNEVAAQQRLVASGDAESTRRAGKEAAAAAAVEPAMAAASAATERHAATTAAVAEARSKLKDAEDAAKAEDVAAAAAETKKLQLEQALEAKSRLENPELAAAVANAAPEAPAGDAAETRSPTRKIAQSPAKSPRKSPAKIRSEAAALATHLKELVDDESLLDAMKVSLAKTPDERGEFDKRVLQQLQVSLTDSLQTQTGAAQALAHGKESRQQALQTLKAAKDSALEADADADMAASNSAVALNEAEQGLKAAKQDVAALAGEIDAAKEQVAKAEARVAEYRAGALAAFEALRTPPAPEPPAAEAAAESAAQ